MNQLFYSTDETECAWKKRFITIVLGLLGCIEVDHLVTDVCTFVKEKEHLLSKDSNENLIQWIAKKPSNLSEINSDT